MISINNRVQKICVRGFKVSGGNPLIHGLFSDPYFNVLWEGVTLFFFLYGGIRNNKFCKVKNVHLWAA